MERKAYAIKTGSEIRGTYELVPGVADCAWWERKPDGSLGYDHVSGTDMFWDGMTTLQRDGKTVFLSHDGEEYTEDEIELLTDEEWNAKWAAEEVTTPTS